MVRINDINIQKLFPAPVYRRGLEYYKKNCVDELVYDKNYNSYSATVYGSLNYFVEVGLNGIENGSLQVFCDCPAFDTYQTCKHIAATLIAIAEEQQSNIFNAETFDYYTANNLIDSIAAIQQRQVATEVMPQKNKMRVEYYLRCTYDGRIYLELRTGIKHAYVVKDIQLFLDNVMEGNEHFFTQKFTYSPLAHFFSVEDIEIFHLLRHALRSASVYESQFTNYFGKSVEREMIVPPVMIADVLEKLTEGHLHVNVAEKTFEHTSFVRDELPFQFSISKNEKNEMMLTAEDMEHAMYLDKYDLLFFNGNFYQPTTEQLPIVRQLDDIGMDSQPLPVTKEQADTFVSEVLPTLKKVGNVQIDDDVAAEIIQVPLHAELFLDMRQDVMVGHLKYRYGDLEIDPLTGRKQNDIIIIRDVDKEQSIMRLIEYANFHYNGKELYLEMDDDVLYEFLYHTLPLFESYVDVFLTNDIRHYIMENEPRPSTSVDLESSSNLLEINFTIDGINDDEIQKVLNAVMEKKRYYRLDDGSLLSLEGEEYTSIQNLFSEMNIDTADLQDGNIQMPVYRGAQIDALIDTKKDYNAPFQRLLHQLQSPEEQVFPLPEQLNATLRDYQKTGFQWFKSLSHYYLGGILADDMGLGKTVQAISYLISEESEKTHLIVAPSSVLYNWKNEFHKFAKDTSVMVMIGTPAERKELIKQHQDVDVWITSYSTLRQDIDYYKDLSFQTLLLDEAQYIKNYATKTSQAIRKIKAGRRFALSGTPIENSINELWAIFQVILPGLMPSQRTFKQMDHEKIAMLTKPFILRRVKQDVLTELPDKIESVSVSELTKPQKELYLGYLRELQQETAQSIASNGFQKNRMKILAGLTRLRQICCHPSMFIENYEGTSGKLEQLMETVQNAVENGKRILIFSQFTSMHDIIIKRLEQVGLEYFYLNGSTPSKERVTMTERFNQGEKSLFLISLKAGGTGLNLTGADTVILYDLWWNPAVEDQATGRAHRFGQKNVVQVIRLITEGTIEEKIFDLQQKKRELIDQVIKPGEKMLSSLSEDDIRALLSL